MASTVAVGGQGGAGVVEVGDRRRSPGWPARSASTSMVPVTTSESTMAPDGIGLGRATSDRLGRGRDRRPR